MSRGEKITNKQKMCEVNGSHSWKRNRVRKKFNLEGERERRLVHYWKEYLSFYSFFCWFSTAQVPGFFFWDYRHWWIARGAVLCDNALSRSVTKYNTNLKERGPPKNDWEKFKKEPKTSISYLYLGVCMWATNQENRETEIKRRKEKKIHFFVCAFCVGFFFANV